MVHYKDVMYCSVKGLFPLFLLLIIDLEGFTIVVLESLGIAFPVFKRRQNIL